MNITIDGINFDPPEDFTILEAARLLGIDIPTLCYHEGLSPWGGCRLCIVEINACTLRCDGPHPENVLCGGCADYQPMTNF